MFSNLFKLCQIHLRGSAISGRPNGLGLSEMNSPRQPSPSSSTLADPIGQSDSETPYSENFSLRKL